MLSVTPTRLARTAVVLSCFSLLTGCVSQGEYDATETSARSLSARNQELVQENQSLKATLEQRDAEVSALQSERANLTRKVDTLDSSLEDLGGRYSSLDGRIQRMRVGLNPATDRALRQLANQHPDLISYDADLGMLRFGSDLTFDSGSDQVKAEAAQGLEQLARILQTSDAAGYDIRVVGHTDSQRIGKSRNRFPTNRHLSVARAISVGNLLQSNGVPGERVEIVGWGQYRPTAPNNSKGGTAANRRVEIYFVSSSAMDYMGAGEPAPEATEQADVEDRRDYPMK